MILDILVFTTLVAFAGFLVSLAAATIITIVKVMKGEK